jgi:hypothetical protein
LWNLKIPKQEDFNMLKSLMFVFISAMTFSAHAQNSQYDECMDKLEYYFLASNSEATTVCRQNSTPSFMRCMVQRAQDSNIHVLDAAPKCSSTRVRIPIDPNEPNYTNFRSCPAKLQARAHMKLERANQICDWDSTPVMQNCILDLTEQARFHSEHAVQYCAFAIGEYPKKVPNFVSCVIDNSKRGFDVYSNVMNCDARLTHGTLPKAKPRHEKPQPEPRYEPNYPTKPGGPDFEPEPETRNPKDQQPAPKKTDRKVPTPVEIKIEGSSNPEVNDQPINTGSTGNSESLPLD